MKIAVGVICFLLGVVLILCGIVGGLYIGVYEGLVMGVVNCIEGGKADPVDSAMIAWGVARFFVLPTIGTIVGWLMGFFGFGCCSLGIAIVVDD